MARRAGGWTAGVANGERRRPRIDDADEIGARADAGERIVRRGILPVELVERERRRRRELGTSREADDADPIRVEVPGFGVCAYDANRLLRVVHRVRLRVVAVASQAVAQDDGVHAVLIE